MLYLRASHHDKVGTVLFDRRLYVCVSVSPSNKLETHQEMR